MCLPRAARVDRSMVLGGRYIRRTVAGVAAQ
jgi:hypothetical protein